MNKKIKIDDKIKTFLNRIRTEKEKKNKNNDKIKEFEIELVEIKFANNPNKLHFEMKELNET